MKKLLFLILSTVYWILATAPARAQELGLSISPPVLETVIKPGKAITQVFTIQNLSALPLTLTAKIIPFIAGDEAGTPLLQPGLRPEWLGYFSLANTFIRLEIPFTLQPNQTEQLILNLTVPANASLGDHYATLLVSSSPGPTSTTPSNSTLSATIGAHLLLSVSLTEHPATIVKITRFSLLPTDFLFQYRQYYFVDSLSLLRFTAVAENTGRFMTKIGGIFRLTRGDHTRELQGLIPLNLLANSSRQIAASPSGELVFKPSPFDLGPYQAALDLRSENSSSHAEITVFLLPLKIGLGLLVTLLLLFIILKFRPRHD